MLACGITLSHADTPPCG